MNEIGKFFGMVKDLYAYPFQQYDVYDPTQRNWLMTAILAFFIYGVTLVVVVPTAWWAVKKIMWLSQRQHCQHAECDHSWTTDVSDSSKPGCAQGSACCGSCQERHIDDAIQRDADKEPPLTCPVDRARMAKVVVRRVVQDVCPACRGVFLNGGELDTLNALFEEDGYYSGVSVGTSRGQVTGLVIGMAVG